MFCVLHGFGIHIEAKLKSIFIETVKDLALVAAKVLPDTDASIISTSCVKLKAYRVMDISHFLKLNSESNRIDERYSNNEQHLALTDDNINNQMDPVAESGGELMPYQCNERICVPENPVVNTSYHQSLVFVINKVSYQPCVKVADPPHKDSPCGDTPHEDPFCGDTPHEDPPCGDPPHEDPPHEDPPCGDPPCGDPPHEDLPHEVAGPPRENPPRKEVTDSPCNGDPPHEGLPREDPSCEDLPHEDPSHEDPSREDPPCEDSPCENPPHEDITDPPRENSPCEEVADRPYEDVADRPCETSQFQEGDATVAKLVVWQSSLAVQPSAGMMIIRGTAVLLMPYSTMDTSSEDSEFAYQYSIDELRAGAGSFIK